jgi:putative membrane protein
MWTRRGWSRGMRLALLAWLLPVTAAAHSAPATPETLWRSWNIDPLVLGPVLLATWLYLRGTSALWQRAGRGRGVPVWRLTSFMAGLLATLVAIVSPLDALSVALFSAHMTQHLVLMLVAAPLLVLGAPLVPMLWALPHNLRHALIRGWKRRSWLSGMWHVLTTPLVALVLHIVAIWVWHAPPLYDGAVGSSLLHSLEHAAFFSTALLFWWVLFPSGGHRRLPAGLSVLYVFAAAMQGGVLGVLLLFAREAWYESHTVSAAAWGMTALEDQQLAGVIMWIPAGMIYTVAALTLFGIWLRSTEAATLARERAAERFATAEPDG